MVSFDVFITGKTQANVYSIRNLKEQMFKNCQY